MSGKSSTLIVTSSQTIGDSHGVASSTVANLHGIPEGRPSIYNRTEFCPPELNSLIQTKMIVIRRSMDEKHLSEECRLNHFKYDLSKDDGEVLFMALELSNRLSRVWFQKSRRPCKIFIVNMKNDVVLKIERPCTCCFCVCNGTCCNKVLVYSGMDSYLGKVTQNACSCIKSGFTIWSGSGTKILRISGPCSFCCTSCLEPHFKVYLLDDTLVGEIHKGMGRTSDEDKNFGASFLEDMDVTVKSLVLAAAFLIDLMYYKLGPTSSKSCKDIAEIMTEATKSKVGENVIQPVQLKVGEINDP